MGTKGSANRQRIVQAADRLFYARGYNQTSFSDISDETGIPRGNFYYYFKTKDDILDAVVSSRLEFFKQILAECDQASDDPRVRLKLFIEAPLGQEEQVIKYGCPIGTLGSELVKDQDHEIAKEKLTVVFDLIKDWMIEQFNGMGLTNKAEDYAIDLLAKMQGFTIIASVYSDVKYLRRATRDTKDWIDQLPVN